MHGKPKALYSGVLGAASALFILGACATSVPEKDQGYGVFSFDLSEDGSVLAFANANTHEAFLKSADHPASKIGRGDEVSLLPNGGVVVSVKDDSERYRLREIAKDGRVRTLFDDGVSNDTHPCASTDGGIVFCRSFRLRNTSMGGIAQTEMQILKSSADGKLRTLTPERFFSIGLSPGCQDDKHVYFVGELTPGDPAVYRIATDGHSPSERLHPLDVPECVSVSKKSDLVAFTTRKGTTYSVVLATKNFHSMRTIFEGPADQVRLIDDDRSLFLLRYSDRDDRSFLDVLDLRTKQNKRRVDLYK